MNLKLQVFQNKVPSARCSRGGPFYAFQLQSGIFVKS